MSAALAVRTSSLAKTFGAQRAVDGIDLRVPAGGVYGFLGPNGSGKTTTIRMLLGLVRPSAGEIEVLGAGTPGAIVDVLHRVGALVEGPAFHPYLSGRANLRRLDAADARADPRTSRTRIDAAIERVGLTPAADKRFRAYSLGMKQRLAIAAALLAPRDLLVLDEPTNGLDPQGTREVRALIGALAREGTTVLVSSHLLSEIEQVCTHLGVMHAGRLVAQGSVAEVLGGADAVTRVDTPDFVPARDVLVRLGARDVRDLRDAAPGVEALETVVAGVPPERVVAELVAAGVRVRGFAVTAPGLEERFIALTGEGFDVSG
ncbi:ABC transporter ATP-binding protein [Agilicoccus flavus]|uniref:ABC transporter ATP-binding protein n=1 Tax=Agilicoccus flavus TaxID=2775968 RepID=UPI001CF6ACA1|nr:ATP-binding cassette domain-containing protein [Agilicoccus flavus]